MKPIIKYRGGKSKEIPQIIQYFPQFEGRYIEPFFGGGAMFFHIEPNNALDKIADSPWNKAKYLLLYVKGEIYVGNLCKIVRTKHDVWTKERLIQSNYPSEPHNSSYFMIRIRKPSDTDAELQKLLFNVKDIPNKY